MTCGEGCWIESDAAIQRPAQDLHRHISAWWLFRPRIRNVSNGLVRDFRAGRLVPVLSDVTAAEVQNAPEAVRNLHQELLTMVDSVLAITQETLSLVAAYEARKILPAKYESDMRHIALATMAEVASLVSWNFKHIVRPEKIRLFNQVNVELGYKALSILSPREVTTYEGS